MLRAIVKRFKQPSTIKLGRWDTKKRFKTNDEVKAVWNSADHCGDQICGDPSLVKELIYNKNNIVDDNNNEFCCRLIGLNSCGNCNLLKNN
jgi:hypothetical protein